MAKEKVTRKLAAIFAADMVGYSRTRAHIYEALGRKQEATATSKML